MTTEAWLERSVFKRLVQFIGLVLFSLARAGTRSLRPAGAFPVLLPAAWFQRSDGGGLVPRRVLSILCIVEQLRPTPRIRAICEYTLALCFPPTPFRRFSPFPLSLSISFSLSSHPSPFLPPHHQLPRRGRHFVLRGVANASAMTAAYSQND